jgi:hypothetical protein
MWGPVSTALGWLGFGAQPRANPPPKPPSSPAEREPAWKLKGRRKKVRAKARQRAAQEREDSRKKMIGGALAGLVASGAAIDTIGRIQQGGPSSGKAEQPRRESAPRQKASSEPAASGAAGEGGWSITGALGSLWRFPSFPMAEASPIESYAPSHDMMVPGDVTAMHSGNLTTTSSGNHTAAALPPIEQVMRSSALISELHRDHLRRTTPSDPSKAVQIYRPPVDLLRQSPVRPSPLSSDARAEPPQLRPPQLSPGPTPLTPKNVSLGAVVKVGGGASGASKADWVDFGGGQKWGTTYLKKAETNENVGESTVYSSLFNSQLLRKMGVVAPEIEYIDHEGAGTIASRGLSGRFEKLSDKAGVKLDAEERANYAKLALMSPVADMHKGNVGWSDGRLGTNDVDTSAPYLTHWHSRLVDRFKLQEERYRTTDVGSNYLGEGRSQDHFLHESIPMSAADIAAAAKNFSSIPAEELSAMMAHYPLQGPASQKLALHSMLKQQELYRQTFDGFQTDVTDATPWPKSEAHARLQKAIAEREANNEFPYSFHVPDRGMLEVRPNERFQRPEGTELWKDAPDAATTNPGLHHAITKGHFGDAVLRMSHETALHPEHIASLIRSAKPYTRSIGAGNPVVELVAKLIMHPSFDKMSSDQQSQVKDLFAKAPKKGNPLRQAFFPPQVADESHFASDNFHKGGKKIVQDAYDRLKKIGAA